MNEEENKGYEYTGTVVKVCDTKTYASGFAVRELVLAADLNSKYVNYAVFQFVKGKTVDQTALLDGLKNGDKVKVRFNVSGNESRKTPGTYFCSLRATSIDRIGNSCNGTVEVEDAGMAGCASSDDDMLF